MAREKIQLVEVGARDGLQNEKEILSVATRLNFITKLANSGLKKIEVGSFVSPKWVPQMTGSGQLFKRFNKAKAEGKIAKLVQGSALVPNTKGMEMALAAGVKEIAVFAASSESFSKKNINCSIQESIKRFKPVLEMAVSNKIRVRGYLSTCFGCPYEGKVSEAKVLRVSEKLFNLGIYELSIGDTIGVADPKAVRSLSNKLAREFGVERIAMHFHDTRGTALANILASFDLGVRVFDTSLGGLGGCPYAPGASGNVATEDVVYMFERMGVKTGVNLDELIAINKWMSKKVHRKLPSRVALAGVPRH